MAHWNHLKLLLAAALIALYSCSPNSESVEEGYTKSELENIESLEDHTDIPLQVTTESFMGFFDEFMWDKEFQKRHIEFPINFLGNHISSPETWEHQSFYSNETYMPVLFTDSADLQTSRLPDSFTVSIVSFKNYAAANYYFKKEKGIKLYRIDSVNVKEIADNKFISFLTEFSKDSLFQVSNVKFSVANYYANVDGNYETVYDSIHPKEWRHLNIVSEAERLMTFDHNISSPLRIVHYRGIENGIYFRYVFLRNNNKWQLVKMENYST